MYVMLGDMLIPDIKDQIHGFFLGNFLCSRKRAFIVDPNIFSLCTYVTETVLLYNEVLCYFFLTLTVYLCMWSTQISLVCETYVAEHGLILLLFSV